LLPLLPAVGAPVALAAGATCFSHLVLRIIITSRTRLLGCLPCLPWAALTTTTTVRVVVVLCCACTRAAAAAAPKPPSLALVAHTCLNGVCCVIYSLNCPIG
jgi:hypothetical protein